MRSELPHTVPYSKQWPPKSHKDELQEPNMLDYHIKTIDLYPYSHSFSAETLTTIYYDNDKQFA